MNEIIKIEHGGKTYSGTYQARGDTILVFHHTLTKTATLHGLNPHSFAQQLLFEIVVRDGRGIPDTESKGAGSKCF